MLTGCSEYPKRWDTMVFQDGIDTCANYAKGETADTNGCSDSQKDTDNDGVSCY